MPEKQPPKLVAHCATCSRETNHLEHGFYKTVQKPYEDETKEYFEEYRIVQCMGCDTVRFLNSYWDSDDIAEDGISKGEIGYPKEDHSYYEFLNDDDRSELPRAIYNLYEELEVAMNHDARALSGIGMRMIIEAICVKQKVPGANLKARIQKLLDDGFLSGNDFEILNRIREIGNDSTHIVKVPTESVLVAGLEAINHLLRSVYIVPRRTKGLRNKPKAN